MMERNHDLSLLARAQEFACYKRDDTYLREHMAVVDALRKRDPQLVEARMREHIANDRRFYLDSAQKSSVQAIAE